jgi:hypothetical protein
VVREREFLVRGAIFAKTRRTFEKPEAPAWELNAETRVHDAIRSPMAEPDAAGGERHPLSSSSAADLDPSSAG